ncbi:MAG: hypothetical protein HYT79_04420 [Elusimicrobia bacterium]|nr:hypothetical protein [Elusimicrobiota bacterium]
MRHLIKIMMLSIVVVNLICGIAWAVAPDLMTYQGRLKENGQPVGGPRDVRVDFCDDLTAGTCQNGSVQTVDVQNGLFHSTFTLPAGVNLDTGNWFLRVNVGAVGGGLTALAPREKLTSSVYAIHATTSAYAVQSTTAAGISNILATRWGGLGVDASGVSQGSLPFFSGVGSIGTLSIGSAGTYLRSSGSSPQWVNLGIDSILNQNFLQAGSTFYVSSASVDGQTLLARTSGNVGIGMIAPIRKLDVNGGILATSSITANGGFFGDGSNLTNVTAANLNGGSTSYIQNRNTLQASSTFYVASGTVDGALSVLGSGIADTSPVFQVMATTLTVLRNGKMGIGTTSPDADLHVVGIASFTANTVSAPAFIFSNTGGGDIARFMGPGNIGIGVVNPGAKLEIRQGGGNVLHVSTSADANALGLIVGVQNNVGVGTLSPQAKLHITGRTSVAPLIISTGPAGSDEVMRVNSIGNVGIGTSGPVSRLDVHGTVQLRGSQTTTGLIVNAVGNVGVGLAPAVGVALDVNGLVQASSASFITVGGNPENIGLQVSSSAILAMSGGNVGVGTNLPASKLHVLGATRFDGPVKAQMGVGTGLADLSGVIYRAFTSQGTPASTVETDLQTYSLPANSLNMDGRAVRIKAWGDYTSTDGSHTREIRLYFGSSVIRQISVPNSSAVGIWVVEAVVVRTASSAQQYIATSLATSLSPSVGAANASASEVDSSAINIKVTGQCGGACAGAGAVDADGMTIEFLP